VEPVTLRPIGVVRSTRSAALDDDWDAVHSRIELDPDVVDEDATLGLDDFSHVDVVFLFDQVDPSGVCRGARHPRGNVAWPRVGILAQRAKDRPNRMGLTTCSIVAVDRLVVEVAGLDAIDGSPVLDLKPHLAGFEPRGEHREPAWATELMSGYW
jgi:tRNA (Thr-GGU) A37 N-methylase